jgi:hypothetical protein
MTHEHPTAAAQSTISAALALIPALDAEQALARSMGPLHDALREAGQDETAAELLRVQTALREALVAAGNLVHGKLQDVAAGAPPAAEA